MQLWGGEQEEDVEVINKIETELLDQVIIQLHGVSFRTALFQLGGWRNE